MDKGVRKDVGEKGKRVRQREKQMKRLSRGHVLTPSLWRPSIFSVKGKCRSGTRVVLTLIVSWERGLVSL